MLSCMSSVCVLDINLLPDVSFANIFSHSIGFLFVLLIDSSTVQKHFSLIYSHLLILLLFPFPEEANPKKKKKKKLKLMASSILPMYFF